MDSVTPYRTPAPTPPGPPGPSLWSRLAPHLHPFFPLVGGLLALILSVAGLLWGSWKTHQRNMAVFNACVAAGGTITYGENGARQCVSPRGWDPPR